MSTLLTLNQTKKSEDQVLPRIWPFAAGFLSGLKMYKFLLTLDGLIPDPDVEPYHDGNGQPEGDHNGHYRHVLVGVDELWKQRKLVTSFEITTVEIKSS